MFSCCSPRKRRKPRNAQAPVDEESRLLGPDAEITAEEDINGHRGFGTGPGTGDDAATREERERMIERSQRLRERLDGIVRAKERCVIYSTFSLFAN